MLPREGGSTRHLRFRDVTELLAPGDLLVLNDTRVTALRLFGRKTTGAEVEVLLVRQESPTQFLALAKPGRRLQPGARIVFQGGLACEVVENVGPQKRLRFEPHANLSEALSKVGTVPLPPYIHEPLSQSERYQTVYASSGGSSAAPTAGLHFTPELLDELRARGIRTAWVTLDVGIDTFRPVEAEDLSSHVMHGERCSVPPETARAIQDCQGRIVAVGTTTVRTLESFAVGRRKLRTGSIESRLFIREGFDFQVIDGMFTNFHMPRTTMLVMISALAGRERILNAYAEALQCGYRFLSFGDSMLIL